MKRSTYLLIAAIFIVLFSCDAAVAKPASIMFNRGGGGSFWLNQTGRSSTRPRPGMTGTWGFKIAKNDSNPATSVSYIDDAVGFTPAGMDFVAGSFNWGDWQPFFDSYFRPVMLRYDGTVDYELSKTDQRYKSDGVTLSDITDTNYAGNAMVEIKTIWTSVTEDDTHIIVKFSSEKKDDSFHAHAFMDADGNVKQTCYYSMFEGAKVGGLMRSMAAGTGYANDTAANEIGLATANGAGWYTTYYSQHQLLMLLHVLIGKSLDGQFVFGRGNESGGSYIGCGATVDKGPFHGASTPASAVKTFYIENFWGNYWKRCAGLLYAQNAGGTMKVYYRPNQPYNATKEGYTETSITFSGASGGYLSGGMADSGLLVNTTTTGGNSAQYYCDGLYYAASTVPRYPLVGGSRLDGALCGPFCLTLHNASTFVFPGTAARLSFL